MLQNNAAAPILGICWSPDQPALILACADNNIKKWDITTNQIINIGAHSQPVKDVYCFTHMNQSILVSGGWDSRVKFWTWSSPTQLQQIGESYVGKPIHYMSGVFPLLVTAHSELYLHYWNLESIFQNNFNPVDVIQSTLKGPTTCIEVFPDAKGFAIGSNEGRCGVKSIDLANKVSNHTQTGNDFAFKCHRIDDTATA